MNLSYDSFQQAAPPPPSTSVTTDVTSKGPDLSYDTFQNQQPAKPGLLSTIGSATVQSFKDLGSSIVSSLKTFGGGIAGGYEDAAAKAAPDKSFNMEEAVQAGSDNLKSTLEDTANKFQNTLNVFGNPSSSGADKVNAVGESALGVLNNAFTLFSAPLAAMSKIQGIGQVADKVNELFGAIGGGASAPAVAALNDLPISDAHKKSLQPLVGDLAALAGQVVAGEATHEVLPHIAAKTVELSKGLGRGITESAQLPSTVGTGASYPPATIRPDMEVGNTTPENQNQKQPVAPAKAPDLSYKNFEKNPTIPAPAAETAPAAQTVTKAASDISDTLVKQGYDALTPDQQAKFTSGSYKNSLSQVSKMLTADEAGTIEKAVTGEDIPNGVHPQILFNAVEALATKNGDVDLLQRLAKSPLATELSEAGSTIGSHGFNDNPNSTVDQLRRAAEAKTGGSEGSKNIEAKAKEAKTTITKTAARLIDYDKILDTLTC